MAAAVLTIKTALVVVVLSRDHHVHGLGRIARWHPCGVHTARGCHSGSRERTSGVVAHCALKTGLGYSSSKASSRHGPARLVGLFVRLCHTNGMVATTPLDPCACERNAQRGNTRRRAAYTWCCPATESLARVALTPAAKKQQCLKKKSRAAKEAGGGGRGSGGSDDAGVAVGDGTDVADRIPSPPRFVWRSPAAVRAVGKVPDVRAIRVPTGKGDVQMIAIRRLIKNTLNAADHGSCACKWSGK